MTEPPTTEGPQRSTLVTVSVGFVVAIVAVLGVVFDMGPAEIALLLLPIVVVAAFAVIGFVWAKRNGHLD